MTSPPLARDAFEAELRQVLAERYHDLHPFNLRMHEGSLGPEAIRTWVRNRYYYQTRIPIKDGIILSKSPDADFRRQWIQRIQDHDGSEAGQGGLAVESRHGVMARGTGVVHGGALGDQQPHFALGAAPVIVDDRLARHTIRAFGARHWRHYNFIF